MNLHSIVAPYIGAVNPLTLVGIRISAPPAPTSPNGLRVPRYETPGALTGSIAADVLTVSAVARGILKPAQTVSGPGIAASSLITGQITGALGNVGTYRLSRENAVGSVAITTALSLFAQVQPLTKSDLMQLDGLNINGDKKAIYLNGAIDGVVRVKLKGGDLIDMPDGQVWLVVQNLEGFDATAGWTKAAMVLQDGS